MWGRLLGLKARRTASRRGRGGFNSPEPHSRSKLIYRNELIARRDAGGRKRLEVGTTVHIGRIRGEEGGRRRHRGVEQGMKQRSASDRQWGRVLDTHGLSRTGKKTQELGREQGRNK